MPIGGFCFFFQLSSLARIRESPTGPIDEKGMQDIKNDLSSPANLVTEVNFGFNSNFPAVDKPEKAKVNDVDDDDGESWVDGKLQVRLDFYLSDTGGDAKLTVFRKISNRP